MNARPVILAVDRNRRNLELLSQFLEKEGYQTRAVVSPEEFDQALAESPDINIALVDVSGFDRSIWERCEGLRHGRIPFVVLSPKHSAAIQQASLTSGARGVLVKPLVARELLGIIRNLLEADG
jgi:DNA-binding response OmpR family regulator